MKLHWEPITLELRNTFRVAHGASDQRHNVLVYLDDGVGEAAAVPYYGETQQGIIDYLQSVPDLGDDPFDMDAALAKRPAGSRAARSAIDEALHDLWGKKLGQPVYKLFGLNPNNLPLTSFSIGMNEPEVMAEQARASGHPVLKIKLGSDKDEAILAAIRKVTNAKLRADANAGWSREQALQLIPRLADYHLEFIEQPLAVDDVDGYFWLKERLHAQRINLPIFADETAKNSHDVVKLAGAIDGVVVKTMKSEGIRESLRMIHTAISFQLPDAGNVSLKLFDVLGKEVMTVVDEYRAPGSYEVRLDASNLAGGMYFYKLVSGSYSETKKMILVK